MIIVYKDVSPNIKSENFKNIMESHIDDKYINLNIANTQVTNFYINGVTLSRKALFGNKASNYYEMKG